VRSLRIALDGDTATQTSSVRQSAPPAAQAVQGTAPGVRYDGGPEEGTRGIVPGVQPDSVYNGPH
jgi:hypothetical protein